MVKRRAKVLFCLSRLSLTAGLNATTSSERIKNRAILCASLNPHVTIAQGNINFAVRAWYNFAVIFGYMFPLLVCYLSTSARYICSGSQDNMSVQTLVPVCIKPNTMQCMVYGKVGHIYINTVVLDNWSKLQEKGARNPFAAQASGSDR